MLKAELARKQEHSVGRNAVKGIVWYSKTRWAGFVKTLNSMLQCKRSMIKVIVDNDNGTDPRVRRALLDDEFWNNVSSSYNCLLPLAKSIAKLESDSSVLSDVPEFFRVLGNAAADLLKSSILNHVSSTQTHRVKNLHAKYSFSDLF